MNVSDLQILLQESIDNATTTMEYLFLSKALASLNMGQIRTVSTFANLPDAASNEGLLVFVDADERVYFSNGVSWYSLAALGQGIVYGWGVNNFGQAGDNTAIDRSSPVSVVGGFTNWCQVSGSVALRTNGTIWAWGNNAAGQLGDNTTVNKSSPVSVVGGFTDWCQVSGNGGNVLALRTNGTAWAWGNNAAGQLGDNTTVNKSSPVSVVGGLS